MRKISRNTLSKKASELCFYIDWVIELFNVHQFSYDEYTADDKKILNIVKKFFDLKQTYDVILLVLFIEKKLTHDFTLSLQKFVQLFNLNLEGCIQLTRSLKYLIKRQLIVSSEHEYWDNDDKEYALSHNCLTAILEYQKELIQQRKTDSFNSFISDIVTLSRRRLEFGDPMKDRLVELINDYKSTQEIKWLRQQNLSSIDEVILCMALPSYALYHSTFDLDDVLGAIVSEKMVQNKKEKEFLDEKTQLLTNDLLKFDAGHFKTIHNLKLTDKTIQGMCSAIECKKKDEFKPQMFTLTNPDIVGDEYLHSNPDLRLIEKMVSQDNYEKIKSKVPRLSILLTGAPGVGKTSFVNHLAIKSGRPILSANISQILGCYVGESEKNLVSLFLEAERAFEYFEVTPLIVFDEAEALLYSRKAKSSNSVSQMNNNIISLLLASLDKFKGILICCTNFSFKNGIFDPALHRRFHLVSEIAAPPKKVLKSIFQNHFPDFSEEQSIEFIDKHPFITPAQIRNIKDKYEVHSMLGEVRNPMDTVSRFAEQDLESLHNRKRKIGFSQNKIHV